jgi:Cu+-exporting ATPase
MLSYEFSIKGMKCSSCSNKIEDILKKTAGVKSSNINLITEMGRVVVDNEEVLIDIKNSIIKMGFKLSSFKKIEKTNSNLNRFFTIKSEQINIVHELLKEKIGIVNIHPLYQDSKIKLEYDPNLIKGWELNEYLLDKKINFSSLTY